MKSLIQEIREWFKGPLLLSGSIATGRALLASLMMGADMGYIGSPFIATKEANATDAYKNMIVDSLPKIYFFHHFLLEFLEIT